MNDGKLTRQELEELFALKACLERPEIVKNVMVFEKVIFALSGSIPDFESMAQPDVDEAIVAIWKLLKNEIIKTDADLGEICLRYVAHLCVIDGWAKLPLWLSSVQRYLDDMLPDLCKELFEFETYESLSSLKITEDDNPVHVHAVKVQTVNHILSKLV